MIRNSAVSVRSICRATSNSFHFQKTFHSGNIVCSSNVDQESLVNYVFRENDLPFARAKLGTFTQDAPQLCNQYIEDVFIQSYLKRYLPKETFKEIQPDLVRFGERVSREMLVLHRQCEIETPYMVKFDAWGRKVDQLVTGQAWNKMHNIAAEEGLIAIAYERRYAEHSRLYGMVKNYLNCPSSGLYSCPLAMTDGAAKIIESLKDTSPWLMDRAYPRLLSRNGDTFWTSGQWMTEKRGGSDVASGTETIAMEQSDGSYRLYGYKWFSSATDADITFTLARVVDRHGNTVQGTKGLSLFYLEVRNDNGELNNIEILKLKDKLGTRQLPTAELLLDGSRAYKVSDEGRGVPAISNMLKLTRIHNATAAASSMRRMVSLARDYSTRRRAFGQVLKDYPLHMQTLSRMEVEVRGAAILCLENMRLLGKEDCGVASDQEENLLRLLVPLSKLYSGKQAMSLLSEGLESFGGQGYIEDTGLPSMLRDAQVLSIWEGTTNILSLDVLRAISKSKGQVLLAFHKDIQARVNSLGRSALSQSASRVEKASKNILQFVQDHASQPGIMEAAARDLAYSLCTTYTGCLLIDHANSPQATDVDVYVAQRWCEKDLQLVVTNQNLRSYTPESCDLNFQLVFEGYMAKDRL